MKKNNPFLRVPENAVFWLLLFSLAAGSAVSLFTKASNSAQVTASGRILSPIHPAASTSAVAEGPLLHPLDFGLRPEIFHGQETLFFQPSIFP